MNVMIDIETMSVSESRALILSVAAIEFELRDDAPLFGDRRLWTPSLRQQLALGRTVDNSTVRWWQAQVTEARSHWTSPAEVVTCESMLFSLAQFVGDRLVWANGATFDLCNLVQMAEDCHCDRPWKYNMARDARTIYQHIGHRRVRPSTAPKAGVAHDPTSDCVEQIWRLWECAT